VNESLNIDERTGSYCIPKIAKPVVSRIIFAALARNVRLQHERKRVDVDVPIARSIKVCFRVAHSLLMRRFRRRHPRYWYGRFDTIHIN